MDTLEALTRVTEVQPLFARRLEDTALVNIATHKYQSGTYTPIDNYLNSFWLNCANLLPLWLAPNMVTLIGLGFNFLAYYLITNETNGSFQGEIRPWVNVVCGLCLFAYQTLDAMDGKHARATKNSTPLGQLFDHGCDALSCPMMILTLMACVQVDCTNNLVMYSVLSAQIPFFLAQWAESRTGTMQHSMLGLFGVTETQLLFVCVHLFAACVPHTFWTTAVGDLGMIGYAEIEVQPNILLLFGTLIPGAFLMVLNQLLTTPAQVENYVQLAGGLAPSMVTVLFLRTELGSSMFAAHPQYIAITLALTMTYMTTQMIVMNMGHGKFDKFQPTAILNPLLLYVFAHCQAETVSLDDSCTTAMLGGNAVQMETLFQAALLVTVVFYMSWSLDVIWEICAILDINCLTINPPKTTPASIEEWVKRTSKPVKRTKSKGRASSTKKTKVASTKKKKKAAPPVKKTGKYNRTTTLVENLRHPEKDDDVSLVLRPRHRTTRSSTRSKRS